MKGDLLPYRSLFPVAYAPGFSDISSASTACLAIEKAPAPARCRGFYNPTAQALDLSRGTWT